MIHTTTNRRMTPMKNIKDRLTLHLLTEPPLDEVMTVVLAPLIVILGILILAGIIIYITDYTALFDIFIYTPILFPSGYLFHHIYKKIYNGTHEKYPYEIQKTLPKPLILDDSWQDVIHALRNGHLTLAYYMRVYPSKAKDNLTQSSNTYVAMMYLSNLLFTSNVANNNDDIVAETIDVENSILWLRYLTTSPLLERTAVLLKIDTEEKQNAFVQRDFKDIELFFEPFVQFSDYVEKVHNDETFRQEELAKQQIQSIQPSIVTLEEEVDALFAYGMKNMWSTDEERSKI